MKRSQFRYLIEIQGFTSGNWYLVETIKPRYKYEESTIVKRFLWMVWTVKRQVITNWVDARMEARKQAIAIARDHFDRGSNTRLTRYSAGLASRISYLDKE
jgi:hypothetical protein